MRVETLPDYLKCLRANINGLAEAIEAQLESGDPLAAATEAQSGLEALNQLVSEMSQKWKE